jgi:AGCS family alanine or glycine:cation symporter
MILLTGMYNVQPDGSGTMFIVENLPGVDAGPGYTQESIDSVVPGKGAGFVAIALFFFGFPAIMAYYYIAEVNVAYLVKGIPYEIAVFLLKVILLSSSFYGAIRSADLAWALGDVGLGIMVLLNSVALLLLAKPALMALKDYEEQKRKGKDPVFNPLKLGIKNADFWVKRYK